MVWVVAAKYVKDYQVWLKFNDGAEKIVDFKQKVLSEKGISFVSSHYFGVTIFDTHQIWEEKPILSHFWRIWRSDFWAAPI